MGADEATAAKVYDYLAYHLHGSGAVLNDKRDILPLSKFSEHVREQIVNALRNAKSISLDVTSSQDDPRLSGRTRSRAEAFCMNVAIPRLNTEGDSDTDVASDANDDVVADDEAGAEEGDALAVPPLESTQSFIPTPGSRVMRSSTRPHAQGSHLLEGRHKARAAASGRAAKRAAVLEHEQPVASSADVATPTSSTSAASGSSSTSNTSASNATVLTQPPPQQPPHASTPSPASGPISERTAAV
ncbi:hypothetical protein EON66_11280 [archaeon]|nr:MAG: hypothetical protein EON66_11280 [archaeon]